MNEQEQSIAIAEACGWVHIVNNTPYKWRTSSGNPTTQKPPDYLNDLNAMHEAEKAMLDNGEYQQNLLAVCNRDGTRIWHATAAQRAEAFLRATGLWVDK